jgi:mono/diheme cytochrome c family protein
MALSRRTTLVIAVLAVVAAGVGFAVYDGLWREQPQPDWIVARNAGEEFGETQFKYLSLASEQNGLPYWVLYVLPSMFPEKLPGFGGYSAFGLPWEEGVELPIGMSKRVIGYPRVGINCALCHTARYRKAADTRPVFVPSGPGHTANVQALSRFFYECAKDPRFNSANILAEIGNFTNLGWVNWLLYRYVVIPSTKRRIVRGGPDFLWTYPKEAPAWGRGRDGQTYSSQYLPDGPRRDGQFGSTQFPAVWNLAKYEAGNSRGEPQRLNVAGDGRDPHSVIVESIVGLLGSAPADRAAIDRDAQLLLGYLKRTPAPAYPFDDKERMSPEQVAAGKAVFDQACGSCHGKESTRLGRVMPIAEIGTDPAYATLRSKGAPPGSTLGYVVPHLDGIWLRAPYLHNGSVPTIRDLLKRAAERPKQFYRGYDVLDVKNLGFVSQAADEGAKRPPTAGEVPWVQRHGMLFDTTGPGNGNEGHEYGIDLSEPQKGALIEFLKTL